MTPIVALLVGLGVGVLITLVAYGLAMNVLRRQQALVDSMLQYYREVEPKTGSGSGESVPVDAEVIEEPPVEDEPLDMHPDFPPVWRIAKSDRLDLHCSCHGNPVKTGDKLLWWTKPDNSVVLYCPDVVDEAEKAAGLA